MPTDGKVIHLGGTHAEFRGIEPGEKLSAINALIVQAANGYREVKFEHQNYGVCKHGGPGIGFPCEECRK